MSDSQSILRSCARRLAGLEGPLPEAYLPMNVFHISKYLGLPIKKVNVYLGLAAEDDDNPARLLEQTDKYNKN